MTDDRLAQRLSNRYGRTKGEWARDLRRAPKLRPHFEDRLAKDEARDLRGLDDQFDGDGEVKR
jgi:hypothetical protein